MSSTVRRLGAAWAAVAALWCFGNLLGHYQARVPRAGEHPRLRPGAESPALRRLREAKAMLDEGRITVDNFEAQKRAILDARAASFGASHRSIAPPPPPPAQPPQAAPPAPPSVRTPLRAARSTRRAAAASPLPLAAEPVSPRRQEASGHDLGDWRARCAVQDNFDRKGGDLHGYTVEADSAGACCEACSAEAACAAWVWQMENRDCPMASGCAGCWLKKVARPATPNAGCNMAAANCKQGSTVTGLRAAPPLTPASPATVAARSQRRIVAIGDTHGDLGALERALVLAGVIDAASGAWTGGATAVVQIGDLVDGVLAADRRVLEYAQALQVA